MKKWFVAGIALLGLALAGCQNTATKPTKQVVQSTSTTSTPVIKITLAKAWTTFKEQFPKAAVTKILVREKAGSDQFRVTGVDAQRQYELTLDAANGKVLHQADEELAKADRDGKAKANDAISRTGLETFSAITKLATSQVGSGAATRWSLAKSDNSSLWQVTVTHGTKQTVVKLDAYTGEILGMVNKK